MCNDWHRWCPRRADPLQLAGVPVPDSSRYNSNDQPLRPMFTSSTLRAPASPRQAVTTAAVMTRTKSAPLTALQEVPVTRAAIQLPNRRNRGRREKKSPTLVSATRPLPRSAFKTGCPLCRRWDRTGQRESLHRFASTSTSVASASPLVPATMSPSGMTPTANFGKAAGSAVPDWHGMGH